MEGIQDFALFVDTPRIYLPVSVCALLADLIGKIRKAVIKVGVYAGIRSSYNLLELIHETGRALQRADGIDRIIPIPEIGQCI
jgi:hypothetical protein